MMSRKSKIPPRIRPSLQTENSALNRWHNPWVHIVLIVIAGFSIYVNTFASPFLFDDYPYLVHNPIIKEFIWFSDTGLVHKLGITADIKHNFILRPVAYFTFALNYSLHGLDIRGYHMANLAIHISSALLVYLLLSLLLQTPSMTGDGKEKSDYSVGTVHFLPLFCALFFVSHPLQTQAVSYIIQRFTALVTLFYLGSLVLYIYARLSRTTTASIACYLLSVFVAILAMKTKENAFTLPIVIALCEGIFFDGSFGKRMARLTPFLITMAIIPLKLMELSSLAKPADADAIIDTINLVNFRDISPWDYLMTQFGVITTYLRLLILPIGQNFDYDYSLQSNFLSTAVLIPLFVLLVILGTGIYLLYRSKSQRHVDQQLYNIIAFGIFWFFITLAVDSSIIPIDDLIFEHRAYLPSIGFFMAGLAGITSIFNHWTGRSLFASRFALGILSIIILCLSTASMTRNRIWADQITFWSDVARKSPDKARGHKYLGISLFEKGETAAGIEEFRTAKKLNPGNVHARILLGKALLVQKRYEEAASELSTATQMDPNSPLAQVVLGEVYEGKGELARARRAYLAAISISPTYPIAHQRLGEVYAAEGMLPEALNEYETTLQLYPDENISKKIVRLKHMMERSKNP